jgi:hypothetical protein
MRLPVEVHIRQDEMRRAAAVRAEMVLVELHVPLGDKTIADDCAEMMLATWYVCRKEGRPFDAELVALHMRELGEHARGAK